MIKLRNWVVEESER
jgi:hypothetical protein